MHDESQFRITMYLVVLLILSLLALTIAGIYAFRAATWVVLSPSVNSSGNNISSTTNTARKYFQYASNIDWLGLLAIIVLLLIMPLFYRSKWHHIGIAILIALVLTIIIAVVGGIFAILGAVKIRGAGSSSSEQAFYNGLISAFISFSFIVAIAVIVAFMIFVYARRIDEDGNKSGKSEMEYLDQVQYPSKYSPDRYDFDANMVYYS